jgi:hypothetical protein
MKKEFQKRKQEAFNIQCGRIQTVMKSKPPPHKVFDVISIGGRRKDFYPKRSRQNSEQDQEDTRIITTPKSQRGDSTIPSTKQTVACKNKRKISKCSASTGQTRIEKKQSNASEVECLKLAGQLFGCSSCALAPLSQELFENGLWFCGCQHCGPNVDRPSPLCKIECLMMNFPNSVTSAAHPTPEKIFDIQQPEPYIVENDEDSVLDGLIDLLLANDEPSKVTDIISMSDDDIVVGSVLSCAKSLEFDSKYSKSIVNNKNNHLVYV